MTPWPQKGLAPASDRISHITAPLIESAGVCIKVQVTIATALLLHDMSPVDCHR